MIGIRCKFECPACGNIIRVDSPFWTKDQRKKIAEPKKCNCGRKGDFRLVGFEEIGFQTSDGVKDVPDELLEDKGNKGEEQ